MNADDHELNTEQRVYYSSSQGPFYNVSNVLMFYGGGDRAAIANRMIEALQTQSEPIQVYGEPGSGKTMMSLVVGDKVRHRYHTIRYDIPALSVSRLLRHLLIELCPGHTQLISTEQAHRGADQTAVNAALHCIESQLKAEQVAQGKPYLLLIDSNDSLDEQTLLILRRLCHLRFNNVSPLHCIVFQRMMSETKKSSVARHDTQLSSSCFWLRPLTLAEVGEYLHHHMMLFDYNRRNLFTREMIYFVADRSGGLFRAVNSLARSALVIARLQGTEELNMSHLLMAGLPVADEKPSHGHWLRRYRGPLMGAVAGSIVLLTAFVVMLAS